MSLRLFLLSPATVFAARVNNPGAFVYPIDEVQFDGVTTGTYSSILPNMTILFGSSAGASDLGISRVRKLADSDTLFFGRSSQGIRYGEVDLTDNCYITIVNDYRVWSKTPYIDPDGVRYMDSDLDWATWGQYSPPVANAGAALVATINSGTGKITGDFDSANSFTTHPSATISAYGWTVGATGAITVGSSSTSAITATWTAGFQWLTLAIADSNSQTHYTHVPILAIDPASDPCISNFTIERHTIRQDGQDMTVRIRESIPSSTYLEGTLAIIFDGEPASASDRSNVLFVGWAETEPTEIDAEATGTLKDVTLNLTDVAGRLKSLPGFSQIIEHVASPAKWGEMTTPDMNRYLHFLLHWQSTALDVADYYQSTAGGSYTFKVLGSDGASLFEQVNRRAKALIPDHLLTCDALGRLRVLPDPLLQATGGRTATVQVSLDSNDYRGLRYTVQRHPSVHWLRSNTILIGTSAVTTAFCIAPGNAPGQGERSIDDGEHLALSQDDLNDVTGNRYARLNAPQSKFMISLAEGSRQGIEPAYMTWVRLTIDSTVAAQRGLTFTNARGLVHEIDIRYQYSRTGVTRTVVLEWERETSGTAAVTVEIEAAADVEDGDYNLPGAETVAPALLPSTQATVGFVDSSGFVYRTADFLAGTPTWTRNTTAITTAGGPVLRAFVVDPFSPGYRGLGTEIRAFLVANNGIYKLSDIFGTPVYTLLHTFAETTSGSNESAAIAASFGRYESVEADNPWIMAVQNRRVGSNPFEVWIVYSRDGGATWSSEIQVSTYTRTITAGQEEAIPGIWLSPRTPGLAYVSAYSASGTTPVGGIWKTTDWGATWAAASNLSVTMGSGLGNCIHVPWPTNKAENIVYHGDFDRISAQFKYRLRRITGASSADISPVDGSLTYGPYRGPFGIRSFDSDRKYLVLAGIANNSDNVDPSSAGTDAVAAIWTSDDHGATWTRRTSDVSALGNNDWATEVAFSSDDHLFLYAWGEDGYIAYSDDFGATWTDRQATNITPSTAMILGICGGPI